MNNQNGAILISHLTYISDQQLFTTVANVIVDTSS